MAAKPFSHHQGDRSCRPRRHAIWALARHSRASPYRASRHWIASRRSRQSLSMLPCLRGLSRWQPARMRYRHLSRQALSPARRPPSCHLPRSAPANRTGPRSFALAPYPRRKTQSQCRGRLARRRLLNIASPWISINGSQQHLDPSVFRRPRFRRIQRLVCAITLHMFNSSLGHPTTDHHVIGHLSTRG